MSRVEQQAVRRRRSNIEAGEADADVHEAASVRETSYYYIIVAGWSNEPYEDGEVTPKQAQADAGVHYETSVSETKN
ncbi:hypothetical protein QMA09_14625, partial [Planococcus sp. APC 3906]|uniref:hypothetical protein n=1 Tax=Planococcus sp. APC 3906 TaxID=3035194 RepID=UPI0025B5AC9D